VQCASAPTTRTDLWEVGCSDSRLAITSAGTKQCFASFAKNELIARRRGYSFRIHLLQGRSALGTELNTVRVSAGRQLNAAPQVRASAPSARLSHEPMHMGALKC
jgi:hypothetical protein